MDHRQTCRQIHAEIEPIEHRLTDLGINISAPYAFERSYGRRTRYKLLGQRRDAPGPRMGSRHKIPFPGFDIDMTFLRRIEIRIDPYINSEFADIIWSLLVLFEEAATPELRHIDLNLRSYDLNDFQRISPRDRITQMANVWGGLELGVPIVISGSNSGDRRNVECIARLQAAEEARREDLGGMSPPPDDSDFASYKAARKWFICYPTKAENEKLTGGRGATSWEDKCRQRASMAQQA